ncbi:MAG TPA: glycerol-3-phosphate dehydrogenase [Deltaproteobacteria bacterium]|nr:glycerol-3-phosphate dehydrogenase [Deltaproteobacteria bacterium]
MIDAAVMGAGAWGTAFAAHLARTGKKSLLWVYEEDLLDIIRHEKVNAYYLPGYRLPDTIECTNDLQRAADSCTDIIIAVPSFALRSILQSARDALDGKRILLLTKGIERRTFLRVSQIAYDVLGPHAQVAVLSGPSFAQEVVKSSFTSVVVASSNKNLSLHFQAFTHAETFRVYTADDVVGVELGGAMKNVMAIGAGIIQGLHLGNNTLAAYITRALAEVKRLGQAMGARETTFMGLSGIGDLILTCTGPLSRNRAFGIELITRKPDEILASQKTVVEGYYTTDAAYSLAKSLSVEMPITEELYRIIYEGKDIITSIGDIQKRDIKEEHL